MASPVHRGSVYRFGLFEVSAESRELFKQGRRIKLQDQPFKFLLLLLAQPGEVVSRESVRQHLWPENTFVEFDQSLGTAVTKLRQALGDTADNPRFIETIPRRGYRFLAPVSVVPEPKIAAGDQTQTYPLSIASVAQTSRVDAAQASTEGRKPLRYLWPVVTVVLLAGALGTYWHLRASSFQVTPADTILLADFVNTTGEPVFDDTLREATEVGLAQSPFLNILSDRKTGAILKQMGRSSDDRVTGRTAIEVCQRAGSKVIVQGSISSLGTAYQIELAAIRCDNSEPFALDQQEAQRKEDVVGALGKATTQLRTRLGESLPSIQKYDVPLEQATTSSLDALKAYNLALSTWDRKGDQDSIPFFKKAIEIDPNFAMAHGGLGTIYYNLNEAELARIEATKAYELRDRVTQSERLSIESRYFLYVTGDLEKAAQVYEFEVQNYPHSAGVFNHLGTTYAELGRYQKAAENLREALRLDPTRATTYSNLANDLLALNQVEEAGAVLAEADRRKFQTDFLLQVNYWRAFLRGDSGEMQRIILRSSDIPGAHSLLLNEQANTEAYYGHFEKAGALSQVAAEQMEKDGDRESAADWLAVAALREAEIGNSTQAREHISRALKLTRSQGVVALAALVMARIRDLKEAQRLTEELDKASSGTSTMLQGYWLPVVRAEMALQQGKPLQALDTLKAAEPFELAAPSFCVATLYPAYLRGQAYLAAGDGPRAAAEFQKLVDHPGLVLNFPLGVLAHLGLARAYARTGDSAKSRAAYQDFFQLWKDADPTISVLRQARAEYSNRP